MDFKRISACLSLLAALVLLELVACQPRWSPPEIQTELKSATPINITSFPNIVELLTATPIATSAASNLDRTASATPTHAQPPDSTIDAGGSPLLAPYIAHMTAGQQSTLLQIGFHFSPVIKGQSGLSVEIYEPRLHDQDGRKYLLARIAALRPDLAEVEFSALNPQAKELTLQLEYSLRGLPADQSLAIDLQGHYPGQSWSIQKLVKFGGFQVQLHTATLSVSQSGPLGDVHKFIQLELLGNNARWRGMQLICLTLIPAITSGEYETACGHELGGIMTAVTLGEPAEISEPLPFLPTSMQFQVTGDFLFLEPWETSFPVSP